MNNKFDELTKVMAQSVTRRGALRKFGVGFAGVVLASIGVANNAEGGDHSGPHGGRYQCQCDNTSAYGCGNNRACFQYCAPRCAG